MRNLIRAEIYRYRKNCFFWLTLCAAILSGAFYGVNVSVNDNTFDDMFVVPLFVILAAFLSLGIGREYGDGTIRNKIITGKTKSVIYWSKLIISIAISILLTMAFLIPFVTITATSALSQIPMSVLLWTMLGFFLLNIAWAVIFTFVSLLISSKEIAGILNFMLIIAIMFCSYQLEFMLGQPEFIEGQDFSCVPMSPEEVKQIHNGTFPGSYSWNTDDSGIITYYKDMVTDHAQYPNPRYIAEPFHTILNGLDSMLPHGQINTYVSCLTDYTYSTNLAEDAYPHIKSFPLYSLFLILILAGTGQLLFRKKDLK